MVTATIFTLFKPNIQRWRPAAATTKEVALPKAAPALPHMDPPLRASAYCPNGEEHEALMAKNMMSNHTDMQEKCCGDCYDIHPIQTQYTKMAACGRHHKRGDAAFGSATSFVVSFGSALNTVNIVAVCKLLVLRVGTGRSEHVCLDILFLASRASCSIAVLARRACAQGRSRGHCLPGGDSGGVFASPQRSQAGWMAAGPPILYLAKLKI